MEDDSKRKWDDLSGDEGASEEDDDLDSDDEEMAGRAAYEKLLPEAKDQVGDAKPSLKDMEIKICCVCRARVTGWVGLMAHARTFKKKYVAQHRGYHKALVEVIDPKPQDRGKKVELAEARVSSRVLLEDHKKVVWPPVVLVDCSSVEQARSLIEESVIDQIERVCEGFLVVCKKIPLALTLLRCLMEPCKVLQPEDMARIDPERKLVDWCAMSLDEAASYMKDLNMDDEKLADNVKAQKLQSWKLEVAQGKTTSLNSNLASLLKLREDKLTELRQRHQPGDNSEALKLEIQRKMQLFEEQLNHKEKQTAHQMVLRRAKMVRQRNEALKQKQHLERLLRKQAKQTSEKMEQLKGKQQRDEEEQRKCLEKIESDFRGEELMLITQHENELKQLQEAVEKETKMALDELLDKQKRAKQEQQNSPKECIVCTRQFSSELRRAVLVPCGHYTMCIECCSGIWNLRKPKCPAKCPVCRMVIELKPEVTYE
ncbi:hypothetical protein SELMODRAFT_406008 [Selaginella moellendorffii]|uniref:RING-type domain-containing protein n=1 Tax=Selaginella moellendorffii TaxID=88036 RepID=D8R0D0_SELML|nr:E3 ubiquitin-protein ligase BRE1B [Selaginella moellendorffii]EFJ34559.1 hypothetical protein SELMODRAFT_406008 [Selaginella moellendorffii]|eukprot:XP_002964226.1 E3 ubiquitin-protein ligase BRE1B [Selaginella moellendorffii]